MMSNKSSLTERVVRGSSIILLFTILTTPIGYLLRVFYSRTLSIEMFGLFYAAVSFFGIFTIFNDLGFGYSVTYLVPKYLRVKNFRKAWYLFRYDQIVELVTSILIAIFLVSIAPWLSQHYFRVEGAESIVYIFCIYLVADSLLSATNKFFTGLQQEVYYSSMQFIRLVFALGFSILFWVFDNPNVFKFAWAWAGSSLITLLIYSLILGKVNKKLIHKLSWDKNLFKLMYSYALPALMASSLYNFINYIDSVALTAFRGVSNVGIYNIIFPIASIAGIFLYPINKLFTPLISSLMVSEKQKVIHVVEAIIKIVPTIGIYFGLFIVIFPKSIVSILFGLKWVELSYKPLSFLAAGFSLALLMSYLINIIDGLGLVRDKLKFSIVSAIVSLSFTMVLTYYFGIPGTIGANILTYIVSVYLFGRIIKKHVNFSYPFLYYLKIIGFSGIVYLITKLVNIHPSSFISIIAAGIVYSVIFALGALIFGVLDKQTIRIIRDLPTKNKL